MKWLSQYRENRKDRRKLKKSVKYHKQYTRDARQSIRLEVWLENTMLTYEGRILPVTEDIAEEWGKLRTIRNIPVADSLIAATAVCHGLTVATRNEKDFQNLGVKVYNPFAS